MPKQVTNRYYPRFEAYDNDSTRHARRDDDVDVDLYSTGHIDEDEDGTLSRSRRMLRVLTEETDDIDLKRAVTNLSQSGRNGKSMLHQSKSADDVLLMDYHDDGTASHTETMTEETDETRSPGHSPHSEKADSLSESGTEEGSVSVSSRHRLDIQEQDRPQILDPHLRARLLASPKHRRPHPLEQPSLSHQYKTEGSSSDEDVEISSCEFNDYDDSEGNDSTYHSRYDIGGADSFPHPAQENPQNYHQTYSKRDHPSHHHIRDEGNKKRVSFATTTSMDSDGCETVDLDELEERLNQKKAALAAEESRLMDHRLRLGYQKARRNHHEQADKLKQVTQVYFHRSARAEDEDRDDDDDLIHLDNVEYVSEIDEAASDSESLSSLESLSKDATDSIFCRRMVPLMVPVRKNKEEDEVSEVSYGNDASTMGASVRDFDDTECAVKVHVGPPPKRKDPLALGDPSNSKRRAKQDPPEQKPQYPKEVLTTSPLEDDVSTLYDSTTRRNAARSARNASSKSTSSTSDKSASSHIKQGGVAATLEAILKMDFSSSVKSLGSASKKSADKSQQRAQEEINWEPKHKNHGQKSNATSKKKIHKKKKSVSGHSHDIQFQPEQKPSASADDSGLQDIQTTQDHHSLSTTHNKATRSVAKGAFRPQEQAQQTSSTVPQDISVESPSVQEEDDLSTIHCDLETHHQRQHISSHSLPAPPSYSVSSSDEYSSEDDDEDIEMGLKSKRSKRRRQQQAPTSPGED